jgi:Zn-dependent M28 family amino/carboxypeptidase
MAYVARQVAFGPRTPRSEGHAACGAWLVAELRRHGADTVVEQTAELDDFGPMLNIMARFNLKASKRILLLAHWDTRPWADEDPDPANHAKPIDGANDGGSGVAVLLELARQLGAKSPTVGVDILLVDAEDSGNSGDDDSWARGTQYWVERMPYGASEPMPAYAILLDMVGGRNAVFPREQFSNANAPQVVNRCWKVAEQLGYASTFSNKLGGAINDDHLPLLKAGIPAIDIIESAHPETGSFNPVWHTMSDNLDNVDATTMGIVGQVLAQLIYSEQ